MIYRLSIYYYRYPLPSSRRTHAPSRWGELACFVGRQDPKNAPTRPIVLWPSTPVQRTLTTPPPAPPIRPTKRAVDGGDSSPFSSVFWHRVFSVAHVGSHPPPPTLTVGPPRHIRAYIEYYNAESHSCANPDGFANRFSVWLRRTAHRIRMPCITNPAL